MRLTKKELMDSTNHSMRFSDRLVGKSMYAKMVQELCEYKDVEEELGIDLITLIKALKNGVYCKFSNGVIYWYYFSNTGYELVLSLPNGFVNNKVSDENEFYFKDYGKTWALTKEELADETEQVF